ncbi:hypothetical protein GOODEAATRI_013023 [Goodea atripinnis]|uniref:Myosin X n=1 Tax=Goodea atripinnis TaxID=208336 RepID=A0ABV0NU68_9TELE
MVIQAHVMGYMARRQYRKLLQCIVVIQKNYRAFYWRRKFLLLRWATLTFQKRLRGQLARRAFSRLLEERRKREEEEHRRKMEEEMERERLRLEAERLAKEVKTHHIFFVFDVRIVSCLFVCFKAEEARRQEELQRAEELASLVFVRSQLEEASAATPETLEELESADVFKEATEEEAIRPQEASQVEEILRLEREIQVLQRQKERQELSLTEASLHRLQRLRDQELLRLEDEACKAAQQFLDSLNFDEIDECVRNIESSLGVGEEEEKENGERRGNDEEEVDEGFEADDEAFKDSPNPSEHGHSDGQRTSGIRTSDDSSEEDPYANDVVIPPMPLTTLLHQPLPPLPPASHSVSSSSNSAFCRPQHSSEAPSDDLVELIPPDEDSDYDQDDYDEGAIVSSGSMALSHSRSGQWSPDYRGSVGTYNSSGAYRFSSEGAQSSVSPWKFRLQLEDSEDDFDRFDTDDELSYRRDSVYSCVTLPYFHSFLFIKGLMNTWKRRWCVLKDETFLWFRAKQEALKQGWLHKKGGGSSTLSRRNWKRRWFVLRQSRLMYFENDSWLHKEMKNSTKASLKLKKRWFLLTHNSLDYYKSSERNALKLGTLVLNSLCSVVQPDEKFYKESGYWNVIVYGRKHSYRLYCKLLNEATRWASSIQNVIDTKAPIDTPTQQLIQDIRRWWSRSTRGTPSSAIATTHCIHRCCRCPTETSSSAHLDGVADPVPIIQGMLQTGQELKPLRDELYCQLIKQTTRPPQPGSPGNLCSWKILACMSCTFIPSRSILRYLKFHLKRTHELFPASEMDHYAAYTLDCLKKTRARENVPSQEEIRSIVARQEMSTTVHCHGGGSCKITINSHTTAGEVVEKLIRGLAMEDSRNMFALFEHNDSTEKAIESRTVVADVLAKFENADEGNTGWKLYFKLYCFLDTDGVPKDSVEFAFMFEQGHYPAPEETLQFLAALRLQYLLGDQNPQATIPEMSQVFPMARLRARVQNSAKTFASGTGSVAERSGTAERKRSSFLEGTLRRSFRSGSLSRQKLEEENSLEAWMREEAAAVKTSVMDKWRKLQGMNQEQAMVKYMALVKEWQGYGSTLFNVEGRDRAFPTELWLGVSRESISVYKRGEPWPLEVFPYELILSFGAPLPNAYKITVEGRELVFETQMVGATPSINSTVMDIAKLMKAYISMIVKKRYSNCQSVSSHESKCSAW